MRKPSTPALFLLAVVGAAVLAVGTGAWLQSAYGAPAVSRSDAERIALRWMAGWRGPAPAAWTVVSVHEVPHRRPVLWLSVPGAAWEVDLVAPGAQAEVTVDEHDGRVVGASAESG